MGSPILSATTTLLAAGRATAPQAMLEDRTLPFGRRDIVVVGSVENGAYQFVESEMTCSDPTGFQIR
jgi:hypothetical protein